MYKHHTVTLMQLSKQSTKASVGLVLPVMKQKKRQIPSRCPQACEHSRNKVVFHLFLQALGYI